MRTPAAVIAYTNFPGIQLQVDGNSVLVNPGPGASGGDGEIRFKQGAGGETFYFPLLILAGGQLDNGSPGLADIAGNLAVTTNSFIYVDSTGGSGRTFQIDACLSGSGGLMYHDFDATMSGGLVLTCPTNTFTGTWSVDQGPLVGAGSNSLGTNSISLNAKGALETLYDISSPAASLTLSNGAVMYLHQNDTFQTVNVNGYALSSGKWTFAQLAAAFPTTFPASWGPVPGSTFGTGSGSITVLVGGGVPVPLVFQYASGSLTLTWSQGTLFQTTNVAGPWIANTNATSPYVVTPTNAQQYYKIQTLP
ncbi:MAG TPA: hypothetical protein VFC44_11945 [Candidatus Saccharimonadales bacterium]|nr:hypothetical protein [Candidatus Saccharimonadales bacterium]